eukprot:scaffold13882_cov72-Skeletonema_dohrnii-CCMP3373.AAC.1
MAPYNESLEAFDCHIHSVRFDRGLESRAGGRPDASSNRLQQCSDAVTPKQCLSRVKDASILSWPTIMGHQKHLIVIFTA